MKKVLISALIVVITTVYSCTNFKQGYSIDGTTNQVTGIVYLQIMEGKIPITIDSTQIVDGAFVFEGSVDIPMYSRLVDGDKNYLFDFYLENSPITIVYNNDELLITGSKEDALYRGLTVELEAGVNQVQIQQIRNTFVVNNPQSVVAAYTLFRQLSPYLTANELEQAYSQFDPSIRQQSIYLQKVAKRVALLKETAIGNKFVDFTLPTPQGQLLSLSEVVNSGKGKWVLLDFWASWCPPCRVENPNLVKVYNQFKDKGFTIFGVSLDKSKDKWVEAIEKDNLTWSHVSDLKFWNSAPAEAYGVQSIPSNVLISPEGIIVARGLHGDNLTNKLNEIFN